MARLLAVTVPVLALLLSAGPLHAQALTDADSNFHNLDVDSTFLARAREAVNAPGAAMSLAPATAFDASDPRSNDGECAAGESATHAAAVEHSAGYDTRARIHRFASLATLPLFGTEVLLGQSLYNGQTSGAKRGVHAAVGAGITGLFAVNTVTGAWNMFGEGRQDPNNKKLRLLHGLLMMAADAGFMATTAYAPGEEGGRGGINLQNRKTIHRNLALMSMSVGTAGYLTMLFGSR